MAHIKCKYDTPACLVGKKPEYSGEWCGIDCGCPNFQGKEICSHLRFRHHEFEMDVEKFKYSEDFSDAGLWIGEAFIDYDFISYLKIDDDVLVDFRK